MKEQGERKSNDTDHNLRFQAAELRRDIPELDVHPQFVGRADVDREVNKLLDQAHVDGVDAVRIITGVGEAGALKKKVEALIRLHPAFEALRDEGGSLLVLLKNT